MVMEVEGEVIAVVQAQMREIIMEEAVIVTIVVELIIVVAIFIVIGIIITIITLREKTTESLGDTEFEYSKRREID